MLLLLLLLLLVVLQVRRLLLVVRRQVSLADIRLLLHPHQGVGRVLLLLLLLLLLGMRRLLLLLLAKQVMQVDGLLLCEMLHGLAEQVLRGRAALAQRQRLGELLVEMVCLDDGGSQAAVGKLSGWTGGNPAQMLL